MGAPGCFDQSRWRITFDSGAYEGLGLYPIIGNGGYDLKLVKVASLRRLNESLMV